MRGVIGKHLTTATLVAVGCLLSPAAAVAARWSIEHAPGQGELRGVSCTSRAECTAVGYATKGGASVSVIQRWDGHKWSAEHVPTPSGSSSNSLFSVSCTSSRTCIAVGGESIGPGGEKTVTLAERWDGTRWMIQRTPAAPSGLRDGSFCRCFLHVTQAMHQRRELFDRTGEPCPSRGAVERNAMVHPNASDASQFGRYGNAISHWGVVLDEDGLRGRGQRLAARAYRIRRNGW